MILVVKSLTREFAEGIQEAKLRALAA